MRRFLAFCLYVISGFVVYGDVHCDSVKVFFALDKSTFVPAQCNNTASMEGFIDSLAACVRSGNLHHIVVSGYASPDGPFLRNDRLANERCRAIAEYISLKAGIPMTAIDTYSGGIAWSGLRTLVAEDKNVMSRDAVLRVLDRFVPDACNNKSLSDACVKNLKAIDQGHTYRWLLNNLFPKLRFSLALYTANVESDDPRFEKIEFTPGLLSEDIMSPDNGESNPDSTAMVETVLGGEDSTAMVETDLGGEDSSAKDVKPWHRFALKTNLLYDAVLVPNLETEWLMSRNWSLALEGGFAILGKYKNEKAFRLTMLSLEMRRWIRPRAPWHGFYVGAFAGGVLYDLTKPAKGYRGEGVMAGLSAGFMWPLTHCLSMEAAVDAGYLYTRYKEYKPMDGHHVYQRTKDLNFFGPLKVKLALVWRFWDLNKSRRLNHDTIMQYEK